MAMAAAAQAAQGVLQLGASFIGHGERRREMQRAQTGFDRAKQRMESLDTSNLYQNLENPFEDLTVNTQQADFMAQQQQAGLAGTMSNLQGAAGGSGIAALAQAMAGQQSQNLQQASSSIQQQQIAGAQEARGLEHTKTSELLGMASERKTQADQAREDAKQSIMKGVGQFAGGAATGLAAAAGAKNAAAAASGNPMQPGSGFGSGGVGKMFSGLFG